jgi:hypothetical protein
MGIFVFAVNIIVKISNEIQMGEFDGLGRGKFEEGDFYFTELGYRVFTEQYLTKRGYCCKNGCKHCPYGWDIKTQNFKKK